MYCIVIFKGKATDSTALRLRRLLRFLHPSLPWTDEGGAEFLESWGPLPVRISSIWWIPPFSQRKRSILTRNPDAGSLRPYERR